MHRLIVTQGRFKGPQITQGELPRTTGYLYCKYGQHTFLRAATGTWYISWLTTKVGLSWVEFVTETSVIFASLRDYKNSQREQDSQLSVFSLPCLL